MIYKNIIIIYIIASLFMPCFAAQKGSVEYDNSGIDYSVINSQKILAEADYYFEQYEKTKDAKFLTTAMGKYYILVKKYPQGMYAIVQLARTYDEKNIDIFAKQYLNIGYDLNKKDPYLNYYCGNFFYKRKEYRKALRSYKIAYDNGYKDFYDLNLKIATIYEKFADLTKAKYYYERAYSLNQSSTYLKDKALQIQSLNYNNSEYYIRKKR